MADVQVPGEDRSRERLINEFLWNDAGREKIAAAAVQPIRLRVDGGIFAPVLTPRVYPSGEIPEEALPLEWEDTFGTNLHENGTGPNFQLIDRLLDQSRVASEKYLTSTALEWAMSVAGNPVDEIEPWVGGHIVMDALSFARVSKRWNIRPEGMRELLRFGWFGLWEDMGLLVTRHARPELLYRFGPEDTVGHIDFTLGVEHVPEECNEHHFAWKVKITGHLVPAESPQVALTTCRKTASIAT